MTALADLDAIRTDPIGFAGAVLAEHGDLFRYEYGAWRSILTSHPADLEHVARTAKDNYVKLGTPDLMTLIPLLGDGLMTADGENWAHQRETLRPAFAHQLLNETVPAMAVRVRRWLDGLQTVCERGEAIDIAEELRLLSIEIVAACLLGVDMGDLAAPFAERFAEMSGALSGYRPGGDRDALQRYGRARAEVDGFAALLFERAGSDGLLHLFKSEHDAGRMSARQMRDQLMTMLVGGGETTSMAVAWTLYLLDRHAGVADAVSAEANALPSAAVTASHLDRLELTWRVLQESMRLFPPVWLMTRIARAGDSLRGVPVSKGDLVVISLFNMHRHPQFWPEPERFAPERFLPAAVAARPAYIYRPFSVGPRTCIGMGFARLEGLLVIAEICRRYRVRCVPGHPVEPEGTVVTLRPRHGLMVTLESRQ